MKTQNKIIGIFLLLFLNRSFCANVCSPSGAEAIERSVRTKPFEIFTKIVAVKYDPNSGLFSPDWDTWKNYLVCAHKYINDHYATSIDKEYVPLLIDIRNNLEWLIFTDIDTNDKQFMTNWSRWLAYFAKVTDYIYAIGMQQIDKNTPSKSSTGKGKSVQKPKSIFPTYEKFFDNFYKEQKKLTGQLTAKSIKKILDSPQMGIVEENLEISRKNITELFAKLELVKIALQNDNSWFGKSERLKKIQTIDLINNAILREYKLIIPYLPPVSYEAQAKLLVTKNVASLIIVSESRALNSIIKSLLQWFNEFV